MQVGPEEKIPLPVQVDPKCIHSALKEFFQPLRTNDTRADFFAVYRKESEEFDRDYAKKYDEDLNTSLIFAGLFSAVSSAFIIDVQSNLQPDPNEMTAAYMRILIHTMNESLFPDADSLVTVWAGPRSEIVTAQCLLYASLATSLFAAFVAMLGKQWVNRYIRNRGGSAEEKSWDRQRKLDGMKQWHFHIVIEGIPVMLQVALVLLGSALSLYLWSINRVVSGIAMAVTSFGFTFYAFLTLAAAFVYNCPYQTPPSLIIQSLVRYVSRNHHEVVDSLSSVSSILHTARLVITRHLTHVFTFWHVPSPVVISENVPLAVVVEPTPTQFDTHMHWANHEADARCVAWVLYSTTDKDVILSSVRFAAEIVLYPAIARTLPTHILVDLLFECIFEEKIIPGKLDQACSVGMVLASVLSIQLCLDPDSPHLKELCERITGTVTRLRTDGLALTLVRDTLCSVTGPPPLLTPDRNLARPTHPINPVMSPFSYSRGAETVPITFKLWISRVLLQTVWRWRQVCDPGVMISMSDFMTSFLVPSKNRDPLPVALKTTVVLMLAIALGQKVSLDDLYVPDTNQALYTSFNLLHRHMIREIVDNSPHRSLRDIDPFLSTLYPLNLIGPDIGKVFRGYVAWMEGVVCSNWHHIEARRHSAQLIMQLLEKQPGSFSIPPLPASTCAPTLLRFLELCEDCHQSNPALAPIPQLSSQLEPEIVALQILRSMFSGEELLHDIAPMLVSVLTRVLRPEDRLQSRTLGLALFVELWRCWPSLPQCDRITPEVCVRLAGAIGDPFQLSEVQPSTPTDERLHVDYGSESVGILLGLTLSDAWRDHLRPSNFASCAGVMSRESGRRQALNILPLMVGGRPNSTMLIKALDRLKGIRNYGAVRLMLLHIWSSNEMYSFGEASWEWVKRETLEFFYTHGTEYLDVFAMHIKEGYHSGEAVDTTTFTFRGVGGAQRRVLTRDPDGMLGTPGRERVLGLQAMCRVRELYQVVGWDPARKEVGVAPAVHMVPDDRDP